MREYLLSVIFLMLFFLGSIFLEWLIQRWRQPAGAGQPAEPRPPVTVARLPPEHPAVSRRRPIAPPREASLAMEVLRRHPSRAMAYVGNQQEVRRGVILMTLLGPCRAWESLPPRPHS